MHGVIPAIQCLLVPQLKLHGARTLVTVKFAVSTAAEEHFRIIKELVIVVGRDLLKTDMSSARSALGSQLIRGVHNHNSATPSKNLDHSSIAALSFH